MRHVLSVKLEHILLAALADGCAPGILLSPPSSAQGLQMSKAMPTFKAGARYQTWMLMPEQQAFLSTEPSPRPQHM